MKHLTILLVSILSTAAALAQPMSATNKELVAELFRRSENDIRVYSEAKCIEHLGPASEKRTRLQLLSRDLVTGIWTDRVLGDNWRNCENDVVKLNGVLNLFDDQTYSVRLEAEQDYTRVQRRYEFTIKNAIVTFKEMN